MTDSQTEPVDVFVRLCGDRRPDECRELSFRIPDGVSQAELLEAGYAIDGHSATKSVVDYEEEGQYVPLSEALRDAQLELVKWFGERDREVVFK
jgi:hypothetical protein